jgi:hypothetical protein
MNTARLYWILLFLLIPIGCRDKNEAPSEAVIKMRSCRRLMENSAAVVLVLRKGMNDFQLEELERKRSVGFQACMRQNPDLPGVCMDLTNRQTIRASVEMAATFCMSWSQKLIECVKKQDVNSPGCQKALQAYRKPLEPLGKKD